MVHSALRDLVHSGDILEAVPDAVVVVSATGTIMLVNGQAERLLGYSRADLVGSPVEILVPEELRNQHASHRDQFVKRPSARPMGVGLELSARRSDGRLVPVEISLAPLALGEETVTVAAVRDQTEARAAQQERDRLREQMERDRLREQMERDRWENERNRARRLESLGQLAGGVAHDFNNLLGVILNYAQFIAEAVEEAHNGGKLDCEQITADMNQILHTTERAIALTRKLLAFGRRDVVRPRVVDLNEIVLGLEDLLRRSVGEHVQLRTRLAAELWPVKVDPGQIEQVLVNLMTNAAQAMSGGGTVTIDTGNSEVDAEYAARKITIRPGRYVRLRISDNGSGMAHEVAERAFEPFYTTKSGGEGSGLGLATVHGIITQAGGDVWIYSEPGIGTTINAMLPITDEEPPATLRPAPPRASTRAAHHETVLVVEDEEALRAVATRILLRNGYEVLAAANGAEALELVNNYPEEIHLLLTDVIMPGMLGKEVAQRVTALRPSVRVLFISGYAMPVLTEQGTLDPHVALLEKPFSENELLQAIQIKLAGSDVP